MTIKGHYEPDGDGTPMWVPLESDPDAAVSEEEAEGTPEKEENPKKPPYIAVEYHLDMDRWQMEERLRECADLMAEKGLIHNTPQAKRRWIETGR